MTPISGVAADAALGERCDVIFEVRPIGFVRSPFAEKVEAPRQGAVAEGVTGIVEILAEHEDALADLDGFQRIWILFWFDRAGGRASSSSGSAGPSKVLPPRSTEKRGVFATRSPHRPNPIGMSAVRLLRVEGRLLHVAELDLLDGTPVLDVKPYLPYADAFPDANAGWLDTQRDPQVSWNVTFGPRAEEQLAWLVEHGLALDLRARIADALALGPQPHAYRRIKKEAGGTLVLAAKEWRARFTTEQPRAIVVGEIFSGYRPREAPALHAAFAARFG